jgi:alanyl-tRNA synthetase
VFGDGGGVDTPSLETWRELRVPVEVTRGNWWSNGPTGPCGPDSEIFVWTGQPEPPQGTPGTDPRWMELWNHVTMRYVRNGTLEPLPRPSVDTGMGLERLAMVVQGARSVFGTDVFGPWVGAVTGLWHPAERPLHVLTDHLRTSAAIIGEGVRPSNTGRGYVLRRLVRRALTTLWREDGSRTLADLPPSLVPGPTRDVLTGEQRRFGDLLIRGQKVLRGFTPPLTPDDLRYLHETHGLPPDLVAELLGGGVSPGSAG